MKVDPTFVVLHVLTSNFTWLVQQDLSQNAASLIVLSNETLIKDTPVVITLVLVNSADSVCSLLCKTKHLSEDPNKCKLRHITAARGRRRRRWLQQTDSILPYIYIFLNS